MAPRTPDEIAGQTAGNSGPVVCSFCSKPERAVQKMIAGPNGLTICNECVDVCNDILADGQGASHPSHSRHSTTADTSEHLEKPEMFSFKCPGCGRKLGIDISSRPPREPDSN